MVDKLHEYEGFSGRCHRIKDDIKERWSFWKNNNYPNYVTKVKNIFSAENRDLSNPSHYEDFSHINRTKSRRELIRISAAVMGIEFSYAAETAFVSPTLLKIGVEHKHMTLVWALSPLIGFFLTPILGSLSDHCHSSFGRRRPFIFIMSLGVLLGLILVPNGESLGYMFGDTTSQTTSTIAAHRTFPHQQQKQQNIINVNESSIEMDNRNIPKNHSHAWGIFFTVLGTVLLDFDADACQSPARAFLLDITVEDDHARGLSTFTVMAGLGGFFGYALGGINWDVTSIGLLLGGHVRAVFTLITIIFIVCVAFTLTSFKEKPLNLFELDGTNEMKSNPNEMITTMEQNYGTLGNEENTININGTGEDTIDDDENIITQVQPTQQRKSIVPSPDASLEIYLKSIIYMPHSIRMLCITNLFCWMAHVCYSLYFTDFVGEAVFNGNPTALEGEPERELYESGIRFGCWGMSMYSLSCACYSMIIEKLIQRYRAKIVYVGGLLVYSSGMLMMALTKHKIGVIIFSWTAGVMYSTLFTMPYLLIAHYHAKETFEITDENTATMKTTQIRGLGTDVAIVSSMVFLAQFILSICMGMIVSLSGTTTSVVCVASTLAFCGSIAATQVMYLDL